MEITCRRRRQPSSQLERLLGRIVSARERTRRPRFPVDLVLNPDVTLD